MILTSFQASSAWVVAAALATGAPASATPRVSGTADVSTAADNVNGETGEPGTLSLYGGARGGTIAVEDATGGPVATVSLRPGQETALTLPPGLYELRPDDPQVDGAPVRVAGGETAEFRLPGRPPPAPTTIRGPAKPDPASALEAAGAEAHESTRPAWKRPVAPIMSALIPGTGQFINGEIGKGFGMLLGTAALVAGSAVLYRTVDPLDGAARGASSESFGTSVVAAAGFGVMTGGLAMLYAAQIMDAYAVAADVRSPQSLRRHRLAIELGRSATVGYRAGAPTAALYSDWSISLMLQVVPRLSIGLSDMSMKFGSDVGRVTIQAGARVQYRVLERDRLWLLLGAGSILQGSVAQGTPEPLTFGGQRPPGETSFAAVPYGQLDLRYFIVDRWSLNLVPRISAPFGTRFYSGDRAIPAHAVTFELGTNVGVYF